MATATKKVVKKTTKDGLSAPVFTMDGKESGSIALPSEIFGATWKADLVHQVVVGMQANARTSTAHTKFRGEVAGGGKKPWKQKGTGRARHGSNRSPIWKGGGVTHGPRTEKVYAVKINRKQRAAALASVLSKKFAHGEIIFVDSLSFKEPKTALAKTVLLAIAKGSGNDTLATKRKNAAIVLLSKKDMNTEKSLRNIGSLMIEETRNLNPVDLLAKKYLIIENPTDSLKVLSARVTTPAKAA